MKNREILFRFNPKDIVAANNVFAHGIGEMDLKKIEQKRTQRSKINLVSARNQVYTPATEILQN
ncbi:MAG: hypothetical protein MUC94_10900 [bacterium]|nr:hypothetical protein [bacterium]